MSSMDYIIHVVEQLTHKHDTRDPYKICDALDIRIRYKDLGTDIKAYYFYHSRIRNIVLNNRISEIIKRILVAHELAHAILHRELAMNSVFQELTLFDKVQATEYEANLFAAELLIDDDEVLALLRREDASFFSVARELYVPAALLDFKLRTLKHKGCCVKALYVANGDFLKNDIEGCYGDEDL